jgi:hypothetical protein
MHTTIKFQCPTCDMRMSAGSDLSGRPCDCPRCDTRLTIPTADALVPVTPLALAPERLEGEPPRGMARRRKRRRPLATPIEMRLPGQLGGLKANVDQKTSNAMATTFLGGLLVALGAFLFAGFMGKGKAS